MNRRMRSLTAAITGAALIGAAGCSPGAGSGDASGESPETDTSSSKEALASVKPCEMLPSETLASFGLDVPGEPNDALPWRPGCDYSGEPISATLYKDKRNTVSSNEEKSVWAEFERMQVNGRSGARAITQGTTKARLCNVMFDAGQGLIQIQTHETHPPDDLDECAKALEIAEKIEPNVPEPA